MIAPVGMRLSFTGGGDCRRDDKDSASFTPLTFSWWLYAEVCSTGEFMDGLRLCLLRYVADESDRGRLGRCGEACDKRRALLSL